MEFDFGTKHATMISKAFMGMIHRQEIMFGHSSQKDQTLDCI
jgi:hypothetical protein